MKPQRKRRVLLAECIAAVGLFSMALSTLADEKDANKAANKEAKDTLEFQGLDDITAFANPVGQNLVGPGTISLVTKGNVMMSFGGQIRIIPILETNWDFGLSGDNPGLANRNFFKTHVIEPGFVDNGYIRSEDRLYFNAMPQDKSWSFYTALEFDGVLENSSVDARSGKNRTESDFGIERLRGTVALGPNNRLHAGWDIWYADAVNDGLGLVYADDNPGFWLTGASGSLGYNVGYWKLRENNFQSSGTVVLADSSDQDRDLLGGYLDFHLDKNQKIRTMYFYDSIQDNPIRTYIDVLPGLGGTPPAPVSGFTGGTADVNSHHLGAVYTGKFGLVNVLAQGVYQFGDADTSNAAQLARNSYDISAYAFGGDLTFDLGQQAGWGLKPHIGFVYTSGDDNPNDGKLGGYVSATAYQRAVPNLGGENTISLDTQYLLGNPLYSFIPEGIGNGTPITTGGVQNLAAAGFGRGDNPGVTALVIGAMLTPKPYLIFKTNVLSYWWNQDLVATSLRSTAANTINTRVDSGYVGTEWNNELTYAFNKNVFLKGQLAFFFPGDRVKDMSSALTANRTDGVVTPGPMSDDVASRVAAELLWLF